MATVPDVEFPKGGVKLPNGWELSDTTDVRYVGDPTLEEFEEVKAWIRREVDNYDDAFDMAVECAHDLGIFELTEILADRKQDRAIPYFISDLTEGFFSGNWE